MARNKFFLLTVDLPNKMQFMKSGTFQAIHKQWLWIKETLVNELFNMSLRGFHELSMICWMTYSLKTHIDGKSDRRSQEFYGTLYLHEFFFMFCSEQIKDLSHLHLSVLCTVHEFWLWINHTFIMNCS